MTGAGRGNTNCQTALLPPVFSRKKKEKAQHHSQLNVPIITNPNLLLRGASASVIGARDPVVVLNRVADLIEKGNKHLAEMNRRRAAWK